MEPTQPKNQENIEAIVPLSCNKVFSIIAKENAKGITNTQILDEVYEIQYATGHKPIYLIAPPNQKIIVGETVYCMKIGNVLNTLSDVPPRILEKAEGRTYRIFEIPRSEIKDASEKISEYALREWNTDERIYRTFIAVGLVTLPPDSPAEYQKYAPHMIVFTNPSTGKSTLAQRLGIRIENASLTGLIGSADMRNVAQGVLHNTTDAVFLDEIMESKDSEVYSLLNSIMEYGHGIIARGAGKTIETRAPLIFMGNPRRAKIDEEETSLESKFISFLYRITLNSQAFSRRIAFTLFSDTVKIAKKDMRKKTVDDPLLKPAYDCIKAHLQNLFMKTLQEPAVVEWLETKDEKQEKAIKRIAEQASNKMVADYILWQAENYRHAKGLALRLAIVACLPEYLAEEITPQELLQEAQEYYTQLCDWNNESLIKISLIRQEVVDEVTAEESSKMVENAPEYLKKFFNAIQLAQTELNAWKTGDRIPLSAVKEKLPTALKGTAYSGEPAKVINRFMRKSVSISNKYLKIFGLCYDETTQAFIVEEERR